MPTPSRQHRRDNADPVRVQRWDRVQLEADLDPSSRTLQGYLRSHAAIAVPGVMEYHDAAGNVTRELIPPEELHNVDSLRSLASLPVTLQHPEEDVTPDNVGSLGVGTMGNDVEILEKSGHVRIGIVLHRRDALEAVDGGMTEVSPGYTCIIDPTPGVWNGQPYDAVQRHRRYNHLAIVDQARGGHTVKLRADGADRCAARRLDAASPDHRVELRVRLDAPPSPPAPAGTSPKRGHTMHPFLITLAALCSLPVAHRDGKAYRTDAGEESPEITEDQLVAAIADAIRELQAKAAGAQAGGGDDADDPEAMKARIQELEGQLAALQQEKADRDAAAMEEQEKADRADMDKLADALRFDRTGWTEDTTAAQRKLDLAKARNLVPADAELFNAETKADGVPMARLDGMITAMQQLHGSQQDAYVGLRVDGAPPKGTGAGAWTGPSGTGTSGERKDGQGDRPPADPMKAALRRRNRDRLQGKART